MPVVAGQFYCLLRKCRCTRASMHAKILFFYTVIRIDALRGARHWATGRLKGSTMGMNDGLTDPAWDGEDPDALPPSPDEFAEVWGNPTYPPVVLTTERNIALMRSAPPTRMNALNIMKMACTEALETNVLTPGDASVYASLVDPVSVLALIEMVEQQVTDEEIAALHQVIAEMSTYIRHNVPSLDAEPLLRRAHQLVGMTGVIIPTPPNR